MGLSHLYLCVPSYALILSRHSCLAALAVVAWGVTKSTALHCGSPLRWLCLCWGAAWLLSSVVIYPLLPAVYCVHIYWGVAPVLSQGLSPPGGTQPWCVPGVSLLQA